MTEATPRPWVPNTCVITGRLVGHPDTCGDCDPCGASIPAPVKSVLDELAYWCSRFEEAQSSADEALALLREAAEFVENDCHNGDSLTVREEARHLLPRIRKALGETA